MKLHVLAIAGYLLFLVFYSCYKYAVAAPPTFSAVYAQSVAILVLITGVAPFLVAWGVLKALKLKQLIASATGVVVGTIACVAGYAVFWMMFISVQDGAPAMFDVAARGFGWGALQGALAAVAANH